MTTHCSACAAAYALLIAGVSVDSIPYAEALETNQERLDAWLQEALR